MSEREEKSFKLQKFSSRIIYVDWETMISQFHEKGTKKAKRRTQVGRSVLFAADLIVFHIS